jgi:phosphatidylinositol alpha-1,6-mannosyltransferase
MLQPRRLRLLMITPNFPPDVGGAQTYGLEIARQLSERCQRFVLLTCRRRQARAVDTAIGFDVRRVACPGDNLAFSGIPAISWLRQRDRFDAIFATHWSAAFAALHSLPQPLPPPVLCAAHGKEITIRPLAQHAVLQRLYDRMRRSVFERAARFVAVSRFSADLVIGAGVDRGGVTTVANGVDPVFFAPRDATALRRRHGLAGRPVLLTVARLVARKGVDRVIAALPRIIAQVADLIYVVVGTGPDEARLRALAGGLGVEAQIRFIGAVRREDLSDWYNACDAFVLPSLSRNGDVEGFGLAVLEASACGKPVIVSCEGGMADAVVPGETGLVVDPDDCEALADAAVRLLSSREGPALGRNGRAHVLAAANWRVSADKLMKTIETAVAADRQYRRPGDRQANAGFSHSAHADEGGLET